MRGRNLPIESLEFRRSRRTGNAALVPCGSNSSSATSDWDTMMPRLLTRNGRDRSGLKASILELSAAAAANGVGVPGLCAICCGTVLLASHETLPIRVLSMLACRWARVGLLSASPSCSAGSVASLLAAEGFVELAPHPMCMLPGGGLLLASGWSVLVAWLAEDARAVTTPLLCLMTTRGFKFQARARDRPTPLHGCTSSVQTCLEVRYISFNPIIA